MNNINGMEHHKNNIRQDIIKDQQIQQNGQVTTTTHGIKRMNIMQLAIKY